MLNSTCFNVQILEAGLEILQNCHHIIGELLLLLIWPIRSPILTSCRCSLFLIAVLGSFRLTAFWCPLVPTIPLPHVPCSCLALPVRTCLEKQISLRVHQAVCLYPAIMLQGNLQQQEQNSNVCSVIWDPATVRIVMRSTDSTSSASQPRAKHQAVVSPPRLETSP
jgi:hypothetical protein